MQTLHIIVRGLVQGVGFRPFVHGVAHRHDIRGYVRNRSDAVEILAQGSEQELEDFCHELRSSPPVAARIDEVRCEVTQAPGFDLFAIRESEDSTDETTDVSPDMAVCDQCIADIKTQSHRISHPLTSCAFCGPRFSIVRSLPYDRVNTTMDVFNMCEICSSEYSDPFDRRFHAQPVSCNRCGPFLTLHHDETVYRGIGEILDSTALLIEEGGIVAMKGIGGFHLACNPFNEATVMRLRRAKRRDRKPFALMFRDMDAVCRYSFVSEAESALLQSTVRPVVLLRSRGIISCSVAGPFGTIGAMLPSMSFHHLLFERLPIAAVVMTSGNISGEPIIIDDKIACIKFKGVADAVLGHNRAIFNRVDDSVCAVQAQKIRVLRRGRGFVPSPIRLRCNVNNMAAAGADLKSCFAVGRGQDAILSQHIGDLLDAQTMDFFKEAFGRLCSLFRVEPHILAHDLHPDYLSTRYALSSGLPCVAIQHHHAHIASCCAQNGVEDTVIGVAFAGTGLGDDGTRWGGEFMIADLRGYTRVSHLRPVGMPGADLAVAEPWRMAASFLYDCFGESFTSVFEELITGVPQEALSSAAVALRNRINCPYTSSAGRLFDAVAALCGISISCAFEAEAAMLLEAKCKDVSGATPYEWSMESKEIDVRPLICGIVDDRRRRTDTAKISARFHSTLIDIAAKTCLRLCEQTATGRVALSGGCFQNAILLKGLSDRLESANITVYSHGQVPCNDGGIALGQLAILGHTRS